MGALTDWGPRIALAAIILLVAHFAAKAVKWGIAKGIDRIPFLSRRDSAAATGAKPAVDVGERVGEVGYWLVWLLGLMAALSQLGPWAERIVDPLTSMMTNFVNYLPNAVGAALVFFIGFVLATIVRRMVEAMVEAVELDRRLTDVGLMQASRGPGLTRLLGIPSSRIDVIYLGVSALHQATSGERARAPLVLYVGSLFNRRHIPELIEGFQQLAARNPDARLEIVGDNRTTPRIDPEQLIAASGSAGRTRWRSYIQDDELAALYSAASAFAFLSDYEGFGLTPLEAMAAGIPVVVLDTPIAREIYGPAAVYLEHPEPRLITDALERLLAHSEERARLIDAGMTQVQRYSWRTCAQRTLQVLLSTR